jgi:hypothetical protein
MLKPVLTAMICAALAACSSPADPKIDAHGGWARATGGTVAAAYVTIENRGGADRLTGVRSSLGETSLHETTLEGGIMRMRPIDPEQGLVVPSNGKLVLAPGGAHVMFTGLQQPLAAGDSFSITLLFDKAGPETVDIEVRPATEAPMAHG